MVKPKNTDEQMLQMYAQGAHGGAKSLADLLIRAIDRNPELSSSDMRQIIVQVINNLQEPSSGRQ